VIQRGILRLGPADVQRRGDVGEQVGNDAARKAAGQGTQRPHAALALPRLPKKDFARSVLVPFQLLSPMPPWISLTAVHARLQAVPDRFQLERY
jgi:hypothetical protein